jgi:hypothetical protein
MIMPRIMLISGSHDINGFCFISIVTFFQAIKKEASPPELTEETGLNGLYVSFYFIIKLVYVLHLPQRIFISVSSSAMN